MMKNLIPSIVRSSPLFALLVNFFKLIIREKTIKIDDLDNLDNYIMKFRKDLSKNKETICVDLGSSQNPRNPFNASYVYGCDINKNAENNVLECNLGFEQLPFKDGSVDYLTAFDLIEHIPRYSDKENIKTPFIFFMNECYRVLTKGGLFLSFTPVYPFSSAFKDPTHNNIITVDTFKHYFSDQKYEIAKFYGIKTNFKIIDQGISGEHFVSLMKK